MRAAKAAAIGVDSRISHLASRQHGRASHWQLAALGLTSSRISRREQAGLLHPSHRGVFAVGYPDESLDATAMGAVLSGGRGSVASGDLATSLLAIGSRSPTNRLEISVATPGGRSHKGIEVHRNCRLHPLDCTIVRGIPTTTAPRTLMDCASRLGEDRLHETVGRAYRAQLLDRVGLRSLLARSHGLRGVALLRSATEELWMDPDKLRSELELRFLVLCRSHPTPAPLVNHRMKLGGRRFEVDFYWPDYRLVVETDGFAFHSDPHSHERDRQRDQDLKLFGRIDVFRYTWRQVTRQPHRVRWLFDRYFPLDGLAG